jgi:hypothetical protein
MMPGDSTTDPPIYPEIDITEARSEGKYIQFLEQPFEWDEITYLFYSYFWGEKLGNEFKYGRYGSFVYKIPTSRLCQSCCPS